MTGLSSDDIGRTYSATRRPDPRLREAIWSSLGSPRSALNVGAGTGAYEPDWCEVVAVEPSEVMIAQRPPGAAPVVQARAEELPFDDASFDVAMAVLSDHHWSDRSWWPTWDRAAGRSRRPPGCYGPRATPSCRVQTP